MEEWINRSPGLPLYLPDFFGIRVEETLALGPFMIDFNADLLLFLETGEVALFISPPSDVQIRRNPPLWQFGLGGSLTTGIVWGEAQTPEDYSGPSWVQGVHTPPIFLPAGSGMIRIGGVEFERAISNTFSSFYLGITSVPTEPFTVYEMPSYSYLVAKFQLWSQGGDK